LYDARPQVWPMCWAKLLHDRFDGSLQAKARPACIVTH